MRASLIRTGSVPLQNPVHTGSTRFSLSRQRSVAGDNNHVLSPRLSLHFHSNGRRDTPANGIHRALSESAAIRSANEGFGARRNPNRTAAHSFPASVRDEEEEFGGGSGGGEGDGGIAKVTGGNGGEKMKIGAYYEELLKSNPTDALFLRNYGKFLHEVLENSNPNTLSQ